MNIHHLLPLHLHLHSFTFGREREREAKREMYFPFSAQSARSTKARAWHAPTTSSDPSIEEIGYGKIRERHRTYL